MRKGAGPLEVEERLRDVALGHVENDARDEAPRVERCPIVAQRGIGLGRARDVAEEWARQMSFRGGLEIVQAKDVAQALWECASRDELRCVYACSRY